MVRCLRTGVVRPKRGERGVGRYLRDRWSETTLPVNSFLIERPDGLVLFDAGQTALAAEPGHLPSWHPFLRLARFELTAADEAAAQLVELGLQPRDVRTVVLSHLHTDHAGGLAPFATAEVIVTRSEWERATGVRGRLRGYLPQHWPPGLQPRLVEFEPTPVGPFAGSLDLRGDGDLLLVPLPGHTPGHAGLLVRDEGRSWLLAGDAGHTASEVGVRFPEVETWAHGAGVTILASHDPTAESLLQNAPEPEQPLPPRIVGAASTPERRTTP
jgi:N-acyl homoserine lactone hydrolase